MNPKDSGKMIQCKCPKEETLKKHTNTRHNHLNSDKTDERKYCFHNCSVSFKTKKSFKKHEQTHSDKDLVNCSECGYEGISEKD